MTIILNSTMELPYLYFTKVFWEICLGFWFGTYLHVSSFCLSLCVYRYVLDKVIASLSPEQAGW